MYVMLDNGYSFSDCLYYMSCGGIGLDGFKLLDNQIKVDEMLREYEDNKSIRLSVIKGKRQQTIVPAPAVPPATAVPTNMFDEDEEYNIVPPVLFAVNEEGVAHKDFVDHIGYSLSGPNECLLMGTQQSVNYEPIKTMPPPQLENYNIQKDDSGNYSDMELDSETEDSGEYVDAIESTDDSSCEDGGDAGMKKTTAVHCEGDTEPEDIYDEEAQTE